MKKFFFLCVLLLAGLLQVTLLDSFKFFNVKLDALLLLGILANFIFGFKEALVLSIVAGALKDALGGYPFGINTLLFPLWSFLIARLDREVSIDNDLFRLILICLVTLLHHTLTGIFLINSGRGIPAGIFLRIVFLQTLSVTLFWFLLVKGEEILHEQNKAG